MLIYAYSYLIIEGLIPFVTKLCTAFPLCRVFKCYLLGHIFSTLNIWLFSADQQILDDQGTAKDTLEFELKVRCKRNPNAPENSKNPNELYIDNNVYSKHMRWIPKQGQQDMFKGALIIKFQVWLFQPAF